MRASRTLLVAVAIAFLGLLAPAPAQAEIEILSRGITPSPAAENTQATITVDVRVDIAPYIIELACCEASSLDSPVQRKIDDENSPETQKTSGTHSFTFNVGPAGSPDSRRIVTVRVADSSGRGTKTQTYIFPPPTSEPPPVPSVPAEPAGPTQLDACDPVVSFGLVRARNNGSCWQKFRAGTGPLRDEGLDIEPRATYYKTRGGFSLNGIPFPSPPTGASYLLVEPTSGAPGGQLGIDSTVNVRLGLISLVRSPVRWKLPTGGEEGRLAAFTIPGGNDLGGLPVSGSVQVLFRRSGGRFRTSIPVQVTLPSAFKPFPGSERGSITGATEITTEDGRGVSLDGGRIEVANAAIGKLALKNLCVSFLSGGVSTAFAACQPPDLNGAPAVSCEPPPQQLSRFDASVLVGLPTPTRPDLGAYFGIARGQFAYGGGFIDNAAIPLIQGITLERVGFGLCLRPSLLLKGDAGLAVARGVIRGDASLTYAETGRGFFVEAAAFMRVADIPVGNGRVRVDSTGAVDFSLNAQILLAGGFLQVNGGVAGFIQPVPFRFNIDGTVTLCINLGFFGTPCVAQASATVSNVGIGGCAGTFVGQFSAFFFYTTPRGGKRFDFGRGCGFQDRVRVRRSLRADLGRTFSGPAVRTLQADPGETFPVPDDKTQYVAHFQGAGAPPKVRITSPSGAVFQSGSDRSTTDGRTFMILENPSAPETSIFLPPQAAPGDWKVEALPGSTVTGIEFQSDEKKPTLVTGKISRRGPQRVVDLRYYVRPGDSVQLDVVGDKYQQQIATGLRGRPCGDGVELPDRTATEIRCARIVFTPTFGYAGGRTVRATVVDPDGATMDTADIARYRAPTPPLPSRVPSLRLVRRGTTVFAVWGSATGGTTRYGAYARLSDGRKLGHTAPKECFAWRIRNVPRRTSVRLQIQAGRQDIEFGGRVSETLKARASYAGPRALRNAPVPRPCASL